MKNFFLILLFVIPFFGIGQTVNVRFDGTIANMDKASNESGVTIAIIQGGKTVSSSTTTSNGKYSVKGPIEHNKPFEVIISKSGFVSKKISFNFLGMNLEDIPPGDLKPVEKLDLELFQERPGMDFSFMNTQSVGEFRWNKQGYVEVDEAKRKAMADKIDAILKQADEKAQQNEVAYNAAIQAADKAFMAKEYQAALSKYEEATKYKPKEQYPIIKIDEIDAIIQKQKEENLKYQQENAAYINLIKAADNFFKLGDYEKAKAKYYEASDISTEQYPLDQIKEINRLVREKEDEAKYKQFIEAADIMVKQKSYRSARDNYIEASKIKPKEQYPIQKIKEIDDLSKAEEATAAKKAQYEKLVLEGEQFVKEEKWEEAKGKFEEALKIESASTYVKGQLDIVNKKLADIKAEKEKAEKIAKLILEGEKAMADKTYDLALTKFKEVVTLDAKNEIALAKITEIGEILALQAKDKELNDKFNALVKQGDDAVIAKKYKDALDKYTEAIKLKQDPAVDIKIQDVQKLLTNLEDAKKKEEEFAKLIAEGLTAFNTKDYTTALSKYEAASEIKPTDEPTLKKVLEIKKLIADQNAAASKQEQIEQLLQEGISLMEGGVTDGPQLDKAKSKFNEVIVLDSKNATAIAKLAELDKLLKAQKDSADKEAKFKENVAKGDASSSSQEWEKAVGFYKVALDIKDDAEVRVKLTQAQDKIKELADQKKQTQEYQKAITEANALRDAKRYTEAIAKYEIAKTINPSESYPQEEINKINSLLADQQSAAEKQKQITELLAEGEKLFTQADYASSKSKFEQVIALDPTNEKAKSRIKDIDTALAKMASQAEKEQQIKDLIQQGEDLFNTAQYVGSESKFKEVLTIDKDNAIAKKYLADIAVKIAEQKNQADVEQKFSALVAQGDKAVSTEKWQEGITAYTDALKLKSDAAVEQKLSSAKESLAQFNLKNDTESKYTVAINAANSLRDAGKYPDAITKYEEAKTIKPSETYPQQEIDKLNQLLASSIKNKTISTLLTEGQTLFNAKDYVNAQTKYQEVLNIDGDNATAKSKLEEIKNILTNLASQSEKEEEFKQLKVLGFQAASALDYQSAVNYFEKALVIKDDNEVKNKLTEIKSILAAQNQKSTKIQTLLAQGESAFNNKDWNTASAAYNEVISIDPTNSIARGRLAQIEAELSKEKANALNLIEFERLKAQGIAEANEGKWVSAKHSLEEALKIKQDKEVVTKLSEVEKQIADNLKAKEIERDYKLAINEAQIAESAKNYDEAIKQYKKANLLKPSEQLPITKIDELSKLLSQQKALSAIDKQYNDLISAGDELVQKTDYVGAIQKYNQALTVKPNEELPVIKAKQAEKLAQEQMKSEQDAQFEKIIAAIKNKINENDLNKARDYIKTASNLRPADPRPTEYLAHIEQIEKENAEYDRYMSAAAEERSAKKYIDAISLYEKAKAIKPGNPEPAAKIEEMRKLLSSKEKEAEQEAIYKQYYEAGVVRQNAQEYDLALNNYKNALNAKPNDSKAIQRIAEIEGILASIAADKKALENADAEFNKIVKEADGNFNDKNYQKASEVYRKALSIKPDNKYVIKQLHESERLNKLEANFLANQQYQKILDVADRYFNEQNYDKALEYYKRALSIKSTDPYPKKKIAEIDLILNPVVEQSAELEPLGEPFDGSLMDGEVALQKAEETRKERKLRKVKEVEEKALLSHSDMTLNKNAELTETISNIYDLFSKIIADGKDRSVDQLLVKSNIEKVDLTKSQQDQANEHYERNSNLSTQSELEDYQTIVSNEYTVSTKKQEENHINVDKIRIEEEDLTGTRSKEKHQEGIDVDSDLTQTKIKIENDKIKSAEDLSAITDDIIKKRTETEDQTTDKSVGNYNESVTNKSSIENINKDVTEKTISSGSSLAENNKAIEEINQKITDQNVSDAKDKHHESIDVKVETTKIADKVSEDDANQIAKRIETTEVLKQKAEDLAKEADLKVKENALKNTDTKVLIENEEIKTQENTEKALNAQKDKVKDVSNLATNTTDSYAAKSVSDDQDRLNTQRDIDLKLDISRQRDILESERTKEKAEQVKETSKALTTDNAAIGTEKKQSSLDIKSEIDKIEVKPQTSVSIPNSLGEKYPEGVSQEMFQRKDDAGILSTIITRRIVVIQGKGDEFVRTQTNSSITYTKNGTPITEYVWQKETQNAKLQRHY